MNLKIRFKNPVFIGQIILAILLPILAYGGLTVQDLISWQVVGEMLWGALLNPYVLGLIVLSVWNALNDPTTKGFKDSKKALLYNKLGE